MRTLSVGQTVKFYAGTSPMIGKIVCAIGTNGAIIELESGTEMMVDLQYIV